MIGYWSAVGIGAVLDVKEAHESLPDHADTQLKDVAVAAERSADDAGSTLQSVQATMSEAQATGGEVAPDLLLGFRDELRAHRARIGSHLRDLRDVYRGLRTREDRRLARRLRRALATLEVELERTALLIEMLLVDLPREERLRVGR